MTHDVDVVFTKFSVFFTVPRTKIYILSCTVTRLFNGTYERDIKSDLEVILVNRGGGILED